MSVNVYTEWGPLREVILGSSINFNIDGFDEVFELVYRDFIEKLKGLKKYNWRIRKKYTLERQEDLNGIEAMLRDRGIRVRRPKQIDEIMAIRTPYFKAVVNALDAPRDMFLCIGNEIIETSPTNRNRYFEGLMLTDVFKEYFRNGAKWTVAPRSRLSIDSIDSAHWKDTTRFHSLEEIGKDLDICFDAANCLKFGRDILMNVGNKNHELGAVWLQRHLGDGFGVHTTRICDCHIDGSIMPLRPGVLLANPSMKGRMHLLPKPLASWKVIWGPDGKGKRFDYPEDHIQIASFEGMGVNVLSLDENTVCVREDDMIIREKLRKNGFDVIPVRLRHCELFGGGLHCITLDVSRDEDQESYWDRNSPD